MITKSQMAIGQSQKQQYEVFHNDKAIGKMIISKTGDEQRYAIKLNFNASFNILLKNIIIEGREEAFFENGVLKYSTVTRKINGKTKMNKQTKKSDNAYLGYDGSTTKAIPLSEIRSNFLSLFFSEPSHHQKIYADNLLQDLKVIQKAAHTYQVAMNNGNFNQYTYINGICSTIELNTSLLTLTLKRV